MATLIFDIETVGESWESFDTITQKSLSGWIDKSAHSTEEHASLLLNLKERLGLSPLTGFIVSICVYDLEREQGAVYYIGNGTEEDYTENSYIFKQRSETEMLQEFWEGAKTYDTFVTFSGRSFDVPFILHRSVVHEVMPTQNLLQHRYLYQQKEVFHIDLQDAFTFYGAMRSRPSLHLFCRTYGIESPKTEDVSGSNVAELFLMKKFRDIAQYNSRDVIAITQLYKKWQQYLAPAPFNQSYEKLIE